MTQTIAQIALPPMVDGWFDTNAFGTAFIIFNAVYSTVFAEVEFIALRRMQAMVAATA